MFLVITHDKHIFAFSARSRMGLGVQHARQRMLNSSALTHPCARGAMSLAISNGSYQRPSSWGGVLSFSGGRATIRKYPLSPNLFAGFFKDRREIVLGLYEQDIGLREISSVASLFSHPGLK